MVLYTNCFDRFECWFLISCIFRARLGSHPSKIMHYFASELKINLTLRACWKVIHKRAAALLLIVGDSTQLARGSPNWLIFKHRIPITS